MSEQQKRRGPKAKHPEGFKELHLKFSGELLAHIQQITGGANYQAYFDELVKRDMAGNSDLDEKIWTETGDHERDK